MSIFHVIKLPQVSAASRRLDVQMKSKDLVPIEIKFLQLLRSK